VAAQRPGPLIVIIGPTASGKSALGLELAEKYGGEIICADSRTVYKGMDIGTAKPTADERARVPHHLLDVVAPDKPFNAARFKEYAVAAIADISKRGKIPFLVGGTGLYVDAVIFDYAFLPLGDTEEREYLQELSVEQLQQMLKDRGLPLPENERNPRHLVRAIETNGAVPVKKGLRPVTLIIGLDKSRDEISQRLTQRVDEMLAAGYETEVRRLSKQYGWDIAAMQAPGYRAFRPYVEGTQTLDEAKMAFIRNDLDLAKRQRTWFKRNKNIHWIQSPDEAEKLVARFLDNS
jgi:tRNA dimethylallyltransferase